MKSNSNRIKKNILPPIILLLLLIVLFTLILESIYTSNSNQNKENLIVNAELIEKSLQLTYTESFDIKKLGPSYLFNNDSSNLFPQQYKIALTPYLNESEVAVFSQTRRTITYQKPIQLNNRSYELSITTKNPFTLIGGRLYLLIFTLFLIIAHGFGMLVMNMRLSKLDEIERALFKKNEAYQVINAKLSNSNIRLSETINELHDAKAKAEESNRLKSAFLANISHEIRTPMNGILGFAQLLKKPDLKPDKNQKYIDVIESSGKRMLAIINDLIDISKLESGLMDVSNTEIDINKIIENVYNFFKPEVKLKGMQILRNKLLKTEDFTLISDQEKIFSILTNLVKNAIKYCDKGNIEIGVSKNSNFLEIYVKDNGPGINTEQQRIIFERFLRGSQSLTSHHEGAGLGLSISKAYVELLGGEIWLKSELGVGSTFFFTLPTENNTNS